eukprot:10571880-Alexandrium_andersonii.AAC.2
MVPGGEGVFAQHSTPVQAWERGGVSWRPVAAGYTHLGERPGVGRANTGCLGSQLRACHMHSQKILNQTGCHGPP